MQGPKVTSLLAFIDRLSLDDRLYWRVPFTTPGPEAEILWVRLGRPEAWTVKAGGVERTASTAGLPALLQEMALDVETFERQLGVTALTQACFADMVREGAIELFGADAVLKSIADTRAFLERVGETTAKLARTPKLRVIR